MNFFHSLVAYAPYRPNLFAILVIVILIVLLVPRWEYSAGWGYTPLGTVVLIVIVLWLLLGFTGCQQMPVHGNVTAGTVVNPSDPTNINVTVGGQLNFLKKPKRHTSDPK